MAKTMNSELQDLLELKNNGAINEEEFSQLKQVILSKALLKPERTGVGWQEIVAVLFGMLGGIVYVSKAKQSINKKAIVLSVAFLWNGICVGINSSAKSPSLLSNPTQTANPVITTSDSSPNLLKSGDFEFSNATAEPYDYSEPADVAGQLVKVSFDVKNTSNKSTPPAYSVSYALKDSQNREFEQAAVMIGVMDKSIKKRVTDNILPRLNQRVSLIFDVAKNAQGFELGVAYGFIDKKWLQVEQNFKTPGVNRISSSSDKGEDKPYLKQSNENVDKPNDIELAKSSISRDAALAVIENTSKQSLNYLHHLIIRT
jgi:hypothetical protein